MVSADAASADGTGRALAEGALVASIAVFHVVDHELVHEHWHVLTHAAAGLVAGGAALALGATTDDLGWSRATAGRGLRIGGLIAAGVFGTLATVALVPAADPLLADPRVDDARRRDLARQAVLDIPIGTAVYEELVFRSALLGLALRRSSPAAAVATTSALFGLWHVLPAMEDRRRDPRVAARPLAATVVPTVLGTAAAGVGFAALRLWSGSVIAPILVHAATNVGALVASGATRRRRHRETDEARALAARAAAATIGSPS
jgi:membrane protease YdiL (CAAX protease family)